MTFFTDKNTGILANEPIQTQKVEKATQIILALQKELQNCITHGSGPFLAAIYDEKGQLVAKAANSVLQENCSHNHAEMNAIKAAEQKLGTFDLSPHQLSLYVTSEPCLMCLGGIMWAGIKAVYYGVPSSRVEQITGFDEGFKPDWLNEFKKRGITVYGTIEPKAGEDVLAAYIQQGRKVYKPTR